MKKVLTLAVALMLCSSLVYAGEGIGLYTDTGGTVCNLANPAINTLVSVYAVHVLNTGSTADQFMVTNAKTTTGMTWLSTSPFDGSYIVLGDVATGVSVAYGVCMAATEFPALTISYFVSGVPAACSSMQVVADPVVQQGTVIKADCSFAEISEQGGTFTINGDATCSCGIPANATEQSTWGKVKSLYR